MGDIVNLNQFRKRKEREQRDKLASENRARSGRGKIEREMTRNESERLQRDMEGKRFDNTPNDDST